MTVKVAPAALPMPRARWPAWRPMIVTKNHLSVVAASLIRLCTRSLPTSTAVVKPNVGTPGGSGRSLSIVFGTWATASFPPSTRATAAAPDAVSSPPIVKRYEAPRRSKDSATLWRVSAERAGFPRGAARPRGVDPGEGGDFELLHVARILLHEPLVAVVAPQDHESAVACLDRGRGDDGVDTGRRSAPDENRERSGTHSTLRSSSAV